MNIILKHLAPFLFLPGKPMCGKGLRRKNTSKLWPPLSLEVFPPMDRIGGLEAFPAGGAI
jgi:hypothetical protein